jgi:hypothetical protein
MAQLPSTGFATQLAALHLPYWQPLYSVTAAAAGTVGGARFIDRSQTNEADPDLRMQAFVGAAITAGAGSSIDVLIVGSVDGTWWQRIGAMEPTLSAPGGTARFSGPVTLDVVPRYVAAATRIVAGAPTFSVTVHLVSNRQFFLRAPTGITANITDVAAVTATSAVEEYQGRATIANPATSIAIVLAAPMSTTAYNVDLTLHDTNAAGAGTTLWYDTKTVNGFTIHVGAAAPVQWVINWHAKHD